MPRMTQAEVDAYNAKQLASSQTAEQYKLSLLKDEATLQDDIAQYLRLKEIPFFRQRMDKKTTGTVGWPDFSYVVKGRACFIECKMPGNELSAEQMGVSISLTLAGALYSVVHSLAEAVDAVHEAEL